MMVKYLIVIAESYKMDGIQCCSAEIKELDLEKQKMEYNNHDLFDKRLKKPKVYRFTSTMKM